MPKSKRKDITIHQALFPYEGRGFSVTGKERRSDGRSRRRTYWEGSMGTAFALATWMANEFGSVVTVTEYRQGASAGGRRYVGKVATCYPGDRGLVLA